MDGTVLVADDDQTIRMVLTQALTRAGCKVHATSSLTTLMRWIAEGRGDAVITDVKMPDGNGLEMLPKIAEDRPGLPVIVISAQNSIMTAIKATEAEAYDYLPKPFDLPELMKRTAGALKARGRMARNNSEEPSNVMADTLPLIGQTPAMQALYRVMARVVNAEMPVLITGESGTGKTLVARTIHDLSDRRTMPFLTITPEDLQGSESAARLMARVRGGTVCLDNPTELGETAQGLLVRMMDAPGEQPPRFITTTQTGFSDFGSLRDDLYYRLGSAVIELPALRDRIDDILVLAEHFLKKSAQQGVPERPLSQQAQTLLRNYNWPGNVRQLENMVRQLGLVGQTGEVGRDEVVTLLGNQPAAAAPMGLTDGEAQTLSAAIARHLQRYFDLHDGVLPPSGLYGRVLREFEHPLIETALEATGGNQVKCAALLGLNRNTLRKKIAELDIHVTRSRKLM